ncbi:MAG: hypothetical protein WCH84_01995 [Verrucomicrobiota bacterium]
MTMLLFPNILWIADDTEYGGDLTKFCILDDDSIIIHCKDDKDNCYTVHLYPESNSDTLKGQLFWSENGKPVLCGDVKAARFENTDAILLKLIGLRIMSFIGGLLKSIRRKWRKSNATIRAVTQPAFCHV